MYNPAVDDSEPLNPEEDGSGFYNALSNSPEFNRYNESAINKAFSEKEVEKMLTPTKQGLDNEEQFSSSKKGTPKRKTTKTPGKLRFNVAETQPSSTPKKSNATKHTRSASTGQQYIQHSPPPSPRFSHPYQQLKGMGDTIDKDSNDVTSGIINNAHNIDIDATTSFANAGVESPPLNHVEKNTKVATDSPSIDVGSPMTLFFKDTLQQQQQTTTMLPKPTVVNHSPNFPSVHSSINSSFTSKSSTIDGTHGFNAISEAPVSMTTVQQGTGNVWGTTPQKPTQDTKSNMAPDSEWTVNPELREKFATQFRDLKPENGFLYGEKARVFFLKSKLQSTDLSAIWKLSDVNKDGKLSADEFCIAMKMVLVKRKGYDIPSTIPESLLKSIPSLASMVPMFPQTNSIPAVQATVAPHSTAATTHLPSLPKQQQHHQHKPQSTITAVASGGASTKTSAFPTQLPLLPPPSRKQLTKNVASDSLSTTAKSSGTEFHQHKSTIDQTDTLSVAATAAMAAEYSPSKTGSLSHSDWPTSLTSDSGRPLRFHSPGPEPTVPLPQSPPQNDQFCSLVDSSEKSTLVTSPNESSKKPLSKNKSPGPPLIGPPLIDLGLNSEVKPPSNDIGPPIKPLVDLSTKPNFKKSATLGHKMESADEDSFDDDEDETSALYSSLKPRPKGGKSNELKPKHSTLRASSSFKKQKPKPPPRPEPYNKRKRRSLSPVDTTEAGYADLSTLQTQPQPPVATTEEAKPEQAVKEPVVVTDPNALYAKVIKRNKSLELMEPIVQPDIVQQQPAKEPVVVDDLSAMYAKVMKGNKLAQKIEQDNMQRQQPSDVQQQTQDNSQEMDNQRDDTKGSDGDAQSKSSSSTSMTAPTAPIIEVTDGIFGRTRRDDAPKLLSIIRVESDSKVIEPETPEEEKPIPLPRKKRHHTRSSSLDLNKVFEKRKSAEQLTVSPDSLTKDLPSAVPPKPPPKPKKHKATSNDQELLPPISRSASLDSITTPSSSSIVTSHKDYFERFPPPLVPITRERSYSQGSENIQIEPQEQAPTKKNKKVPILPPHMRPKQETQHTSDHHHTTSSHIEQLQKAITNSREHLEEPVKGNRDKAELQKSIKSLQQENKALTKLNTDLQEMLHKLMEERTTLVQELESHTTKHYS